MTIKTTGKKFLQFYNDGSVWGYAVWHEEEKVTVDGVLWTKKLNEIPPKAKVEIRGGFVHFDNWKRSFEDVFDDWVEANKPLKFTVTVPVEKREAFLLAVRQLRVRARKV